MQSMYYIGINGEGEKTFAFDGRTDQGFGGNTGTLKIEGNIDAADHNHKGMERALKATIHGYCAQV